ncbi:hypothetical protein HYH03_016063 [Edaphochlamys debaryana]|uniref:Phosphodiesterase n=1 Tax=Edaphochlamys debaryana TaxID=47281 RepID=A0A836BRZ4_9CHLO|nr:hypothetical protein HYH03_016063 [Edaphochlamys debaryana]|eukprot:KAG2485173.1 hypothetical protein HYH03_016063 [Edaphochlamys debaryana]
MLGHDLLAPAHVDHGNGISIVAGRRMALIGPLDLGDEGTAIRATLPVFVRGVGPNTSFDAPDPVTPLCGQPCAYDASTGSMFWGLAVALIHLDVLHTGNTSRLQELGRMGYAYELLAPPPDTDVGSSGGAGAQGPLVRLAGSSRAPKDPVEVVIRMQNVEWYLRAAPHDGWAPSWFAPMLAVVIVVSLAMAVLLFAVMVSRRQHQQLLEALLPREMIDDLRKDSNTHRLGPRMLEAATTADLLLDLLADLLEGTAPDLRDIVLIRQQILQNMDIYRPLNLSSQLKGANLDDDVTQALMHQLGGQFSFSMTGAGDETGDDEGAPTRSGASLAKSTTISQHDYATLSGALAMLLAPQGGSTGWYDSGPDVSDATSDAALPTHDNEAAVSASPRLSTHPVFARAASHLVSRSNSPEGVGMGSGSLGAVVPHPPRERPRTANQGGAERDRRGSILVNVGADGGPGLVPTDSVADGGPAGTGSVASASAVVAVTDGGGAAANGPSGSAASSLFGNILGHGGGKHRRESNLAGIFAQRGRRKSALLTVSIFEGEGGGGGGGGSSCGLPAGGGGGDKGSDSEARKAGKTLSNGSQPDLVVQEIPASHMGSSRLGVALTGTSRRSLTNQGMVAGMAGAGGSVAQAMMMAAKKPPTPPAPVIEEVERVLAGADSWTFDTYKLREVTQGHPLSALGFYLIQRAGLIPRLKLKPAVLARLLRHIEAGYVDNPYHNATHAADVLQTLHVIIHGAQLHVHYLDSLGLLAAYWAAIVHDYGHPGLTNDFLINTADPLAVRYNDRSPLENHHAAASFSAMRRPGLDLLSPLSGEQKSNFRKQVIDMVLATDMKQHFSLISHFVTVHRLAQYTAQSAAALGAAPHKAGTSGSGGSTPGMSRQTSNTRELVPVSIAAPINADAAPRPVDDTERLLSLQIAIKAADIGHLGEQLDVHRKWLAGLEEEFFRQGDKEKLLGLPISPLFDRAKQGVGKSQVGFYDFVALPLVHALSSAFPGAQPLMRTFITNYNHYRSMDGQPTVSEPRSGKLGVASFNRQPASLPLTPSGNT